MKYIPPINAFEQYQPTQCYLIYDVSIPFFNGFDWECMSTAFKLALSEIMVVCFTFAGFLFQMKSFNTDWALYVNLYVNLDIPKVFYTKFISTIVRRRCDQI